MASSFPAFIAHGEPNYPLVAPFPVDAAAAFLAWDLVFLGTGSDIEVCGADPANILGFALVPAAAKTLYPNGRIPVAVLNPDTVVGMSSATTPADAHLTVLYGIEKTGNNWRVDTTDTTNTKVQVVKVDPTNGIFYVRFLAAALQGDAIVS